eukprot:5234638-Alexandrium_andersonii.AAC.1
MSGCGHFPKGMAGMGKQFYGSVCVCVFVFYALFANVWVRGVPERAGRQGGMHVPTCFRVSGGSGLVQ